MITDKDGKELTSERILAARKRTSETMGPSAMEMGRACRAKPRIAAKFYWVTRKDKQIEVCCFCGSPRTIHGALG